MTSILLAYDGSPPAAAAARAAGALFPGAEAIVLTVRREPVTAHAAGAARIAIPDAPIAGAMEALEQAAEAEAARTAAEGARAAAAAGLSSTARVVAGAASPWREIRMTAAEAGADLIACGSRGLGGLTRLALGSTSSGLVHHGDRPLLIVREFEAGGGPVVIGYDGSAESRDAVALTGRILAAREAVIVHVWESLIRHSLSGRALAALPLDEVRALTRDLDAYFQAVAADVAEEGAALAREAGLRAAAAQIEAAGTSWHGLLGHAHGCDAAVVVVGARGRGGMASALGSVSSGLAHNADLPVLVVRGSGAENPGSSSGLPADDGERRRS
jgi:nucleotide-binding universal stress UspA family protein